MFGNAVSAEGDTAFGRDIFPEKARAGIGFFVAGQRSNAFEANHLRNLRVGMLAGELILVTHQRLKHGLVNPNIPVAMRHDVVAGAGLRLRGRG